MPHAELGKMLIVIGVVAIIAGVFLVTNTKVPFLGRLPGDINVQKEGFSFHFPITTCIIISIVFSLILALFMRK